MSGGDRSVTVAVVPRERLSCTADTVRSVCEHTSVPYRLLVVDAGSPHGTRRALAESARAGRCEVLRTERWLTPNEARNLAFANVDTDYVAFIDNDVLVTPGWLEALLDCAEGTGAGICGPLQLIGPLERGRIHIAGGIAHVQEHEGRRILVDAHRLSGQRVEDVQERLRREPCEQVEFHCMLVRSDLLRELGPLDEALLNVHEHTDLCLQARARGWQIWFEPASRVTYVPPGRLTWRDRRYFMLRWSERWTRASVRHFAAKWELDPQCPGLESTFGFARWHRSLAWRSLPLIRHLAPGALRRTLRPAAMPVAALFAVLGERRRRRKEDRQ